ncbi:MAG: AMP-binding protein [Bdellovibrionaceae bacterium]|nr:AMP-binding protein [Pseudobdellovibrionaceae bacterium]
MEKIWLKHYAPGIPAEINPEQYAHINDMIAQSCKEFAHHPCYSNMGTTLRFSEIDQQSEKFASFLQNELKLKKGDRLAIQMPNLLQYPIAVFGALRAGLIVVNVNPLYTAREMQYQLKDSGAKAIVILANYAHLLEQIIKNTEIESVIITEIGDLLKFPKNILVNFAVKFIKKMVPPFEIKQAYRYNESLELGSIKPLVPVEISNQDIAFLQYTGGTTGVSKGAMLTHRNMVANMVQVTTWLSTRLERGVEIALAPLPIYHIFALTACLGFMSFGSHNVLITNPRDFKSFIADMKRYPFTLMTGVNTLFNALMNQPQFSEINFKSVKVSLAGGMALQRAVYERWTSMTQSLLIEGFGLTETSPLACANPLNKDAKVGTIGLPVSSTEVKIISEDGSELGIGGIGELCIKGPQVMKGYWQRPDETSKVLKDGWLLTGDIATIDEDGFVKIVDRKKDMILVSGFNVYPNEIEDVIAAHPGVLEVAAVGIPDPNSGEAVKVVIVRKDPNLTSESVIDFARKSLTNYKIPRVVEFRTELPKTNVGKILRRALREA